MSWQPRNDYVLIRVTELGESPGGVALPDSAIQGKKFTVDAVGPAVIDLALGDEVLMLGSQGAQYYPLPNSKQLFVIRQEHVVLKQATL